MEFIFQKAKNDEITVKCNDIFLHSSYNPSKESERFVDSISLPYKPKIVFFTEPCLSYITKYFKYKYPDIKIGVIRYINSFEDYNKDFDYIINYYEHEVDFESYFQTLFSETDILSTYFLNWKPSTSVFPETDKKVWLSIKNIIDNAKTMLVTRQYFEKKWFYNTCSFLKNIKNTVVLSGKINKPVLIVSSGPSLKDSINIIKSNRNKFFILALSSAITLLFYNDIIPDLLMSTDGGFWAGEHLKKIKKYNVPVAIPTEAFFPKSLFYKTSILPLKYKDGISNQLINSSKINFMNLERNGTVSGSALCFALENSDTDIYFCGLDMSNQIGFQHCQPNEIEINNCLKDNKVYSKELRITRSQFNKGVMDIYLNWFKNFKLNGRKVYRVINEKYKNNNLGQIEDISTKTFTEKIDLLKDKENEYSFSQENTIVDLNKIKSEFNNLISKPIWKEQLFPLDLVSLSHNPSNTELKSAIEERNNKIISKIRKSLDE